MQSAEVGVHDYGDENGLELVRGHEAEHDGVGWRRPCSLVVHHGAVLGTEADVDVVAQRGVRRRPRRRPRRRTRRRTRRRPRRRPMRGDDAHLEQLLEEGVLSAQDGAGLLVRRAPRRGVKGRRVEGREQLELRRDVLHLGAQTLWRGGGDGFGDGRYQRRERGRELASDAFLRSLSLALFFGRRTRHRADQGVVRF